MRKPRQSRNRFEPLTACRRFLPTFRFDILFHSHLGLPAPGDGNELRWQETPIHSNFRFSLVISIYGMFPS